MGKQKQHVGGPQTKKKDYRIDRSLPDIKNRVYITDEFRMYKFKVKLCSWDNAPHDLTECPFAHSGETAIRRDPKRYYYRCFHCREFQNGSCSRRNTCRYAHGVFESLLHPAKYRIRFCKDETECTRKVCFFAHKPEELCLLKAYTSSALPSPTSNPNSPISSAMDSLTLSSPSSLIQSSLTPPWTPSATSSPAGGTMWQTPTQIHTTVPTLQMPSNRLKTALNARDNTDLDMKFLENHHMPKPMLEESNRLAGVNPNNHEDIFESLIQSSKDMLVHQNVSQELRGYPSELTNSKRCQSFMERSSVASFSYKLPSAISVALDPSTAFSDWRSTDRKVDWSIPGDKLNEIMTSYSFGFLDDTSNASKIAAASNVDEHYALLSQESWVSSLLKDDDPTLESDQQGVEVEYQLQCFNPDDVPS